MIKKSLILSSAGLKNLIPNQNYADEFKFIIGEHEVKMKNIFAEFISPYVSQIHQSDPTIDSISFSNIKSNYLSNVTDEIISLLKLISIGNSIEVDKAQCLQLQIISLLLKNDELYQKLDSLFPCENDENKVNKELGFISFLMMNSESSDIKKSKSIKYIASNLYSIDTDKIKALPKAVFYSIIINDELTVESEDSLLDLIEEYFKDEEKESEEQCAQHLSKIDFYEEINFDFLSENKFKEFIENFDSSEITATMWNKLKKCFYVYKNSSSSLSTSKFDDGCKIHHYNQKARLIEYDGKTEHAFKGIIHELTKEASGNVDDKGYVKVTSSSVINIAYSPKNAVDLDNIKSYFESNNVENSWLQYDFMERKVIPTHYSIRSRHNNEKNGYHPKNWVIEGSNDPDSKNWINLDSQQNVDYLNDARASHTFDIKNTVENKDGFRYLRIRYTGPNWSGNNYMVISALEYFGQIIE